MTFNLRSLLISVCGKRVCCRAHTSY